MTGQVKEDLLTRRGELGVRILDGAIVFDPVLLRAEEFAHGGVVWTGVTREGALQRRALRAGQIATTVCQRLVVYAVSDEADVVELRIVDEDGTDQHIASNRLDEATSQALFARRDTIEVIEVTIPADRLR